ncbi:hypothetical protein Mp_1g06350 [Marchantia polymorpha subsp. ruderalis]|uniref:Uncharacterized protein n=2 Tax=Marchantia polymorpha TaxID=3197 RepID=A0AAF6AM52_MARPO|nr:hypothetical protein MARPO_0043s0027 [Marchantia polymorpha]BBM97522.1 hypothetical protein Mp_1g06350 [Marchantia polymorpha subsp. ruderalis]|eukprot:PTQ39761.1 hypothetical protein MARPO_0043s0027 [Marchantia polymorpha]
MHIPRNCSAWLRKRTWWDFVQTHQPERRSGSLGSGQRASIPHIIFDKCLRSARPAESRALALYCDGHLLQRGIIAQVTRRSVRSPLPAATVLAHGVRALASRRLFPPFSSQLLSIRAFLLEGNFSGGITGHFLI